MMDPKKISRRDFLKLLALVALSNFGVAASKILPVQGSERADGGKRSPNILILLFDTLSARHLSFLGYRRETAPNLARFAERATVYHRHYAAGNFTIPGTASLLTGAYPWSHRGLHYFGTVRDEYVERNLFSSLADDYYISAFTHNAFALGLLDQFRGHIDEIIPARELSILSQPVSERLFPRDFNISFWGERVIRAEGEAIPSSLFLSFIGKDFDSDIPTDLQRQYKGIYPRGLPNNLSGTYFLLEQIIDWLKDHLPGLPSPFLGYYHLLPPHEPYKPRAEFTDIFADGWAPEPKPVHIFPQQKSEQSLSKQRRQYDEYIAFVDAEFGRLVDSLERTGALEETYLIVTSDHGQLFERQIHGHVTETLYEPLIRIPLLISKPGQKKREDVFTPTSSVDLLPTIVHLAGKPLPDWCEGQVLPTFNSGRQENGRSIYVVEAKQNPKFAPLRTGSVALVQGGYKLIHYFGYPATNDTYEFYNLDNDPDEYEELYPTKKKLVSDLKEELVLKIKTVNHELEEGKI
jgi:choline-sulfatase